MYFKDNLNCTKVEKPRCTHITTKDHFMHVEFKFSLNQDDIGTLVKNQQILDSRVILAHVIQSSRRLRVSYILAVCGCKLQVVHFNQRKQLITNPAMVYKKSLTN